MNLEATITKNEPLSAADLEYIVKSENTEYKLLMMSAMEARFTSVHSAFEEDAKNKIEAFRAFIAENNYSEIERVYNDSLNYYLKNNDENTIYKQNVIFAYLLMKASE